MNDRHVETDDITLAYDCAKLYYEKGLSQNEISNMLKLSRPKVSRLLALARRIGIVNVILRPPDNFDQTKLANQLCEKYMLGHVFIGVPSEESDLPAKRSIGRLFQEHFPSFLGKETRVGLGWGTTIYNAMRELQGVLSYKDVIVSPLVGGAGESQPAYQVNNLVDLCANWLQSKRIYLMGPAVFETPEQLQSFANTVAASSAIALWARLDIAVFSVGGPIDNSDILYSSFPKDYVVELIKGHAIGDILARFFDRSGQIISYDIENIFLGIPFNLLLKVPERICVAGGAYKINSLDAALRAGYITTLMTDLYTAQSLINL